MASLTISDSLVTQLQERCGAGERVDQATERAVEIWLDLTNGKGQRGGALAFLLDELAASAQGEMPLPDRDELADWLRLVQTVADVRSEGD